ncbi:putative phage abortive infection protein [Neotabrizicola sp. sgz301269]|uniref:putative phage abortive infection protein n=1 Tax=Neotabrizicola sp. sgz301269 TaxID=3276282 RepID=UPI003770258D
MAAQKRCALTSKSVLECRSNLDWFLDSPPNEIGDTLAGFAGALAFIWIVVTVWLQSHELSEQRKEITTTNRHLEKQSFNAFFFELVATHNSIVSGIDIRTFGDSRVIHQGRDAFHFFFEKFSEPEPGERMYPDLAPDRTLVRYGEMYAEHRSDLGHYFRFVYNSLRAIEESPVVDLTYKRLFRSLFSDDELLVIYYNCATEKGRNLAPRARRFDLFNNLPFERLVRKEHIDLLGANYFD